eukprot:Clim_evm19s152 gene=Clim_evmTU19s152
MGKDAQQWFLSHEQASNRERMTMLEKPQFVKHTSFEQVTMENISTDRTIGTLLLVGTITIYTYLAAWIIMSQFIPDGTAIKKLFPPEKPSDNLFITTAMFMIGAALMFTGVVYLQRATTAEDAETRKRKKISDRPTKSKKRD